MRESDKLIIIGGISFLIVAAIIIFFNVPSTPGNMGVCAFSLLGGMFYGAAIVLQKKERAAEATKNFGKKGQAAMEFLFTYGWAILVVFAAIGALIFFHVIPVHGETKAHDWMQGNVTEFCSQYNMTGKPDNNFNIGGELADKVECIDRNDEYHYFLNRGKE
jgi:hypothetical protein